ncbi:OsmC family protein [Pedobacter miscanthi]|jgi:uncharacterized OsmC-like protein|uniref:OsmC family protein n=1 Tax=Pedobacter miscanthi TaxID=2259170 RepID=UPI00293041A7|nr:OsmC family protein [Pedobacter miscanthi]
MLNEINLEGLEAYKALITKTPAEAISAYGISAKWQGGVKTQIHTHNQFVGTKEVIKNFTFDIDEPEELLGSNLNPTPQDYLLGGLAGCMMVGFVAEATARNIKLESVALHIVGDLNLRGFLAVDEQASIGFKELKFNYEVKGSGTHTDYNEIIKKVQQYSPNYRTITDSVIITASEVKE